MRVTDSVVVSTSSRCAGGAPLDVTDVCRDDLRDLPIGHERGHRPVDEPIDEPVDEPIDEEDRRGTIMSSTNYATQHRGDRGAYERYLAGMDASMRQKVALTAAHLTAEGRVADMGMGSGAGSHALAALYPALDVVGVDVNATMVRLARERYQLENLSFRHGDIAEPVFEPASLDAIFDSSVLHHVTSFGGYDHEAAARALAVQVQALRPGGVLIVRDFLAPVDGSCTLELPTDDGDETDDPRTCCTAALLERFAREFRSLHHAPGIGVKRIDDGAARPNRRTYRLSRKAAVEFLLRKDYRHDWEREVQEEYTYFTQARFEAAFAELGLRVLASTPIWNPWIVEHRFRGRFRYEDETGRALEDPPTNYVIVGERVPPGQGVRFEEAGPVDPVGFLELEHFAHRESGRVYDLAIRPHLAIDAVPFFELDGDLFVIARKSYPRPVLMCDDARAASLDGATAVGYVTEPICVLRTDRPLGRTVERVLADAANIEPEEIRAVDPSSTWYPSPGGLLEEVRSVLVETEPKFVERDIAPHSGYSTSGHVCAIECGQLLRAAQVGGLPDARLEMCVRELLPRRGRSPGPWIGAAITLDERPPPARPRPMSDLLGRPRRRQYVPAEPSRSSGFLVVRAARIDERDAAANVVASAVREWVVPRALSLRTMTALVLRKSAERVFVGLADDDLPAAQAFEGHSDLLVVPAWRLPRELEGMSRALSWVRERLELEHGIRAARAWPLGGRYHPSAGVTPEVVFPFAFALDVEQDAPGDGRSLTWTPLDDAARALPHLRDGHLRISLSRAAHALGNGA